MNNQTKFTMEDAMRTQADHLANYYFILNEEAYRRLALEVKRNNDLGYTNPYHVFRGGDLSQALHDIMQAMRGESESAYYKAVKEQEANYLNSFMSTLGEGKFARKCDATGKGMNEGYCIQDGGMYIHSEVDMLKHLEEHTAYESMEEAFQNEYCYWTEWTDLDEDGYYLADGTFIDTEEDEVEEDEDEVEMSEADKREQREIDAFEDDRQSNWD